MKDYLLTPEEVAAAVAEAYNSEPSEGAFNAVARKAAEKVLKIAADWLKTHSQQRYEHEWIGDDYVAVDYMWIKKANYDAFLKDVGQS